MKSYLDMESIGRRLKIARSKIPMTYISAQIGSDRGHLNKIEHAIHVPNMKLLCKMVNSIDARFDFIFANCSKTCNGIVYCEMLDRIKGLPEDKANILQEVVKAYLAAIKK